MRLLLLLALAAAGACATSAPLDRGVSSGTAPADTLVAGLSVLREPDGGGLLMVVLPPGSEPSGSAEPSRSMRLMTPAGDFEAAFESLDLDLSAVPPRTMRSYRATEAALRALDAAGASARIAVNDGRGYQTYRIHRDDVIE